VLPSVAEKEEDGGEVKPREKLRTVPNREFDEFIAAVYFLLLSINAWTGLRL
jgi:hypothetical protein